MIDLQLYMIANAYGLEPQLNVLQEECAELIQAISKYRRDGITLDRVPSGLIENIADVEIMLGQMRILLGEHVDREIDKRKDEKIRLQIHLIQSEDNKMTGYNDRVCDKCEEKETCEDYKHGIEHGLIPFGCSKLTESEDSE